ncbi:hypothetical protein U9M48_042154 [Paspalum notatum var. saurae]|uniref:Disease resistance N-terminal domain-containing protein n=1 Tax=Paspalum notatum var. saurae TaxID=547442 RepID=A0AAQ3UQA0_PASNO
MCQVDELVRLWACDVREASYEMEDIVDAFLPPKFLFPLANQQGESKLSERRALLPRLYLQQPSTLACCT